jgi:hypothetical protein
MTSTAPNGMTITMKDLGPGSRERLRERLEQAAQLTCPEHGQRPVAVDIHGRENGWFDARWTTCCETLEQQAVRIVKERF